MTQMKTHQNTDRRRYGVIETRYIGNDAYHLTINGELWSEVEWSPRRQTWCIQDAEGRCLAHCEHTHATHIDQHTAVALAKRMIRDGRMPTPEEAQRRLHERQAFQGPQEDGRMPTPEEAHMALEERQRANQHALPNIPVAAMLRSRTIMG
jgi:hypothetical protein